MSYVYARSGSQVIVSTSANAGDTNTLPATDAARLQWNAVKQSATQLPAAAQVVCQANAAATSLQTRVILVRPAGAKATDNSASSGATAPSIAAGTGSDPAHLEAVRQKLLAIAFDGTRGEAPKAPAAHVPALPDDKCEDTACHCVIA